MEKFDYNLVFETAREFARKYSENIIVQDITHESILVDGVEYPCVPLKLLSKGNSAIYQELLSSGCCTKMDGCIEEGKRIYKVLLWLEPDCISIHQIKNFK